MNTGNLVASDAAYLSGGEWDREILCSICRRGEPFTVGPLRQDGDHPLVRASPVVVLEPRILVDVDSEHGVALVQLAAGVAPVIP